VLKIESLWSEFRDVVYMSLSKREFFYNFYHKWIKILDGYEQISQCLRRNWNIKKCKNLIHRTKLICYAPSIFQLFSSYQIFPHTQMYKCGDILIFSSSRCWFSSPLAAAYPRITKQLSILFAIARSRISNRTFPGVNFPERQIAFIFTLSRWYF
jgi:hypothetical protein